MKQSAIILLAIFMSLSCFSQIKMEKGYYINNSGKKIDCFIKNIDWKNNPTRITYALSENGEQKRLSISSVKEFGVTNTSKHIRQTVNIDRSSELMNNLTTFKAPRFLEEQLFLKVLIEGKANLYSYYDNSLKRYFFKTDSLDMQQLVFKSYKDEKSNKVIGYRIRKNNHYKQQLLNSLKCSNITLKDIERLEYKKNDLTNFFIRYNECENAVYSKIEKKQSKITFNLNVRPGINSASLKVNNDFTDNRSIDYGSKVSARFGIEAEFIMPFNKNKWALIFEPTYQSYEGEKELIYVQTPIVTRTTNTFVDYKSIEIPIGIRHYSFISEDFKLFFNLSMTIDFPLSSSLYAERRELFDLDISSRNNMSLGMGLNYNKYSFEVRYGFNRAILGSFPSWDSDYKNIGFIFGYTII